MFSKGPKTNNPYNGLGRPVVPAYLPGDVLRTPDGNLWKVAAVIGDIYTLHAPTADKPVSATLMGRELRAMGVEKVARMPEEIRAEAMALALAEIEGQEVTEAVLARLWDLAFLTGLSTGAAT